MLEITLFGPTTVVLHDGSRLTAGELGGVKSRQILEVLALTPGVPVAKEQLAERLWDQRPPRTYLATLESYVCVLRRALKLERGRAAAVATTSRGYVLREDQVRVDVVEVRRRLRDAAVVGSENARRVEEAVRIAMVPLLASDHGADWVVAERDSLGRALVEGCSQAAANALTCGETELAVSLAVSAIALDPMAEAAVRTVMRAWHAAGRRADALRAYAALRQVLAEELGLGPARETHEVYLQILRSEGATLRRDADGEAHTEVRALLELLRQVLSSVPGLELPSSDRGLAEAAGLWVQAA